MRFRFDGGTVLLDGDGAETIARDLPALRWDARVGAFRAPAFAWPRIRQGLDPASHLRRHALAAPVVLDGWSGIDLRPYQESALMAWELAGRRGIVVLPTGSGKTKVALAAMARTGLSTLCLVPTRVLLDQWTRAIGAVWSGQVGRLGDGVRNIAPHHGRHVRERIPDDARAGEPIRPARGRRGASLRSRVCETRRSRCRWRLPGWACPPRRREMPPSSSGSTSSSGPSSSSSRLAIWRVDYLAPFDLITLRIDLTIDERRAYEG